MIPSSDFTPREFFQLVKEMNEHEAELKIKLAKAGVAKVSEHLKVKRPRPSVHKALAGGL